jgi:hypothetical protein
LVRNPGGPHVLGHEFRIEGAEPVGRPILAAQHRKHAGRRLRRLLVDGADARMWVRREHEGRIDLARQIDVRDVTPAPGQKARILGAGHRLSDAEAHAVLLLGLFPSERDCFVASLLAMTVIHRSHCERSEAISWERRGTDYSERRKSIIAALTSCGRSCWVQ